MLVRSRLLTLIALTALVAGCDRPTTAPDARPAPSGASRVITGTGLTIYTDRAAWEAAVAAAGGTVQSYDFAGLPLGRVTQTLTNYGPFSIEVDAVNADPFQNPGISIFPDASCSLGTGDCDVFTFNMIDPTVTTQVGPYANALIMPQTIQAWGGDMVQAGYTAPPAVSTGVVTVATASGSFTLNDYVSGTGFGFVGFVTTVPTIELVFTFAKSGSIVNEVFQVYNPAFANGAVVTTPAQRIGDLRAQIAALALPGGTANSLDVKLQAALDALGASNTALACSSLQDLINHTNAQSGKKIAASDAAAIVSAAATIRGQLGC